MHACTMGLLLPPVRPILFPLLLCSTTLPHFAKSKPPTSPRETCSLHVKVAGGDTEAGGNTWASITDASGCHWQTTRASPWRRRLRSHMHTRAQPDRLPTGSQDRQHQLLCPCWTQLLIPISIEFTSGGRPKPQAWWVTEDLFSIHISLTVVYHGSQPGHWSSRNHQEGVGVTTVTSQSLAGPPPPADTGFHISPTPQHTHSHCLDILQNFHSPGGSLGVGILV